MQNIILPPDLSIAIGSERKDFAVKAEYSQLPRTSFYLIVSGLIWTTIAGFFSVAFLGPIFQGKEIHFTSNGVPAVAGPGNLGSAIAPIMVIGVFLLIGVGILIFGIYSIFKKGGYFVGTSTRLVHYQNGNIRSIDWEQFSGDIEVSGRDLKGNISLQMRTGRVVRTKNGPERYVPNVIYMSGIPDVFEVEQFCRKRIKENDPTPPITEGGMRV